MIVAMTGFHGSGKSHLAEIMKETMGWSYLHKRSLMEEHYLRLTEEVKKTSTWNIWQKRMYQNPGHFKVMEMLLREVVLDDGVLLVDSVHHPEEWRAIKMVDPQAILVGVFSPSEVRFARRDDGEDQLDEKRLSYWHEEENGHCLLSQIEWAFVGHNSREELARQCLSLGEYLKTMRS